MPDVGPRATSTCMYCPLGHTWLRPLVKTPRVREALGKQGGSEGAGEATGAGGSPLRSHCLWGSVPTSRGAPTGQDPPPTDDSVWACLPRSKQA